jgi:hypothetical protein
MGGRLSDERRELEDGVGVCEEMEVQDAGEESNWSVDAFERRRKKD